MENNNLSFKVNLQTVDVSTHTIDLAELLNNELNLPITWSSSNTDVAVMGGGSFATIDNSAPATIGDASTVTIISDSIATINKSGTTIITATSGDSIATIELVAYITLDETSTTYTRPEISGNASVHLYRTFTLNSWNSLCLPFAVSNEQIKEQFGDDTQIGEFKEIKDNTFYYDIVDKIEKGKPYFLWPTKTPTNGDYYEFSGIKDFADKPLSVLVDGANFIGSFVKTTVPVGAIIARKNLSYIISKPTAMKGFRAYLMPYTA